MQPVEGRASHRWDDVLKRAIDVAAAVVGGAVLCVPAVLIGAMIRLTSAGPTLYWSDRVGKDNRLFRMPKFRTMRVDTPAVATHLLGDPSS